MYESVTPARNVVLPTYEKVHIVGLFSSIYYGLHFHVGLVTKLHF